MSLAGIDHFVLTVRDIDATCRFYEAIGMVRERFGDGRTALKFGDQKINVHEAGVESGLIVADNPTVGAGDFCLLADDLDAMIDRIAASGLALIEGPVPRTGATGPIRSVYLKDPDGNLVEIAEYAAKPGAADDMTATFAELLSTAEMAEADRLTIASGTPGIDLMDTAGAAVAEVARRRFPGARRVLVACGPGNNGGDGWVAAAILHAAGLDVTLASMVPRAALNGDAALAAGRWEGDVADLDDAAPGDFELVIDALFGAGLARPIDGSAAAFILRCAVAAAPVLAVDVPSGVDGTTGEVLGPAMRADATVTFFRAKPGHHLYPGRALVGALDIADIGIGAGVLDEIRPATFLNAPVLWRGGLLAPPTAAHKYARGHVAIVSGPLHRTGAARLAARGALRAGAGLVTIASPKSALMVNAAQLTAIMLAPVDSAEDLGALLSDSRLNAVAIGPAAGIGEATAAKVEAALGSGAAIVIDADGLTSFETDPQRLFTAIAGREAPVVLTPHEGEFARLFPDIPDGSKLERARAAAEASGAIIVLKGPDTVIAAPGGIGAINANAEAWLATAGSGDVLAGIVPGLLAQSMPGFEAAAAGVWLHGAAGRGPGLIAEDIPDALPGVLARLMTGET